MSTPPIVYPLAPPTITGIGPQDFTLELKNLVSESVSPFTFGEQIQIWPGDMFTIMANLPPMPYVQAEQWLGFLNSCFGKFGTFLMGDYNRPTPQGLMDGSPVVNGTNLAGSNSLNVRGAAAGKGLYGAAGDYVQVTAGIGKPARLYKLVQDCFKAGGTTQMIIRPSLREQLTDGVVITTSNCKGTFRLMKNSTQWKVDKDRMYTISFQAREALLP